MTYQDQEFLRYVVTEIVEHPDSIKITRKIDPTGILLELEVHPDDMGRIIGRGGRTADAIRKLLWVIGTKTDNRISFKIIEPGDSNYGGKKYNDIDDSKSESTTIDEDNSESGPVDIATSPDEASEI
jgi:predicted RNA-binding protein YlqC (UPF0109 family)